MREIKEEQVKNKPKSKEKNGLHKDLVNQDVSHSMEPLNV